jgi:hypothetical protein
MKGQFPLLKQTNTVAHLYMGVRFFSGTQIFDTTNGDLSVWGDETELRRFGEHLEVNDSGVSWGGVLLIFWWWGEVQSG